MRRGISLLLAGLLLLGCLAGCGGSGSEASPTPSLESSGEPGTSPQGGKDDPLAGLEKKDLDGYEMVIKGWDKATFAPTDITGPETEARAERNRLIEEFYNCSIVHEDESVDTFFDNASPAILAGDKWADVLVQTMWGLSFFIARDMLLDLQTVSTLNLSAEYWDQNVVKASTMNGKTLELVGDIKPAFGWAVFFNKNMIQKYGLDDPYELVEKNEWTIDKYREMARAATKDLNGDGVMSLADDDWGHTGPAGDYHQALWGGTTIPIIGQNAEGKMAPVFNTPDTLAFVETTKKMFLDDGSFMDKTAGDEWTVILDPVKAGRVLFLSYIFVDSASSHLRDVEFDWGVVPMPKFKTSQEGYGCWVDHNTPILAMTKTNPDTEKVGLILDAMGRLSLSMVTPAMYDQYDTLYFRDDKAADMMKLIQASAYYDPTYFLRQAQSDIGIGVSVIVEAMSSSTTEFASAYESRSPALQDALDKFFKQGAYAET